MKISHPIAPVYDASSRILILGSFPSAKSRESGFFYGHPQNRFWRVLAVILGEDVPQTVEEKKQFLLRNKIALWDVIAQCEITGSADSSIKNVVPNDIGKILAEGDIRRVFVNGKTAQRLYDAHILPVTGVQALCLPSTSPANAAWTPERLIVAWSQIKEKL